MAALGAQNQAHRHASHRTGHHNGNRRTTTTRQHADIEHVERCRWARTRRTSAECTTAPESCIFARLARTPVSANLPASARQVRRVETTQGQHDSPVTCAPVGGQQAAQCMAASPPPPRGAVGVRGGAVPRPSTPCCAGTSNCRDECTSHCPASSSPAAAVKYIPAHDA